VNITLDDDINIARGDMLVKVNSLPKIEKKLSAKICWMDTKELVPGTKYTIQHNTNKVLSKIDMVHNVIAADYSGIDDTKHRLALNEIGEVSITLSKPLYYDKYKEHTANGSFILIDTQTKATAGVGFIQ